MHAWLDRGIRVANFRELPVVMVRLQNISKQNGNHLLFIEASASPLKGEKAGLVGPNGAGKTTCSV